MRICLYTETALPVVGGQELGIDALARAFQRQGHEPSVLTLRLRKGERADDRDFPYPIGRHRRYFSTRHLLEFYCGAVERHFRKHPFDILHCHNVYPAAYVAAKWCRWRRIPLVVTSHACDIANDSHLLRKPRVLGRVREVVTKADKIIALSKSLVDRFRFLGANDRQLVSIPNGVNAGDYETKIPRPESLNAAIQPKNYFLFLGRLVERKGVDLLIDAFRQIATQTAANLVVAGSGSEQERFERHAGASQLTDRVIFHGAVSGHVKTYLLQNAICTLMPSRVSEGSSLVVLESFAASRPVIGSSVPGLAETIRDRQTGLLVPEESVQELADAMMLLAKQPDLADAWGSQGRDDARRFDWSEIAEKHLAVYSSVQQAQRSKQAA